MIIETKENQKRWHELQQSVARNDHDAAMANPLIWADFVSSQGPDLQDIMSQADDLLDFFESLAIGFNEWIGDNPQSELVIDEDPFDDPKRRPAGYF